MSDTQLPEGAYAAALAGLPRMTIQRLSILLDRARPSEAFAMITGDRPPIGLVSRLFDVQGLAGAWRDAAATRSPEQVWEACRAHSIAVIVRDDRGYPPCLLHDPSPPPVLFVRGDLDRLIGRRVGIVGTRNATNMGRDIAATLGHDLAQAGVHVVSGLARGIDGYAHRGALRVADGAAPVAVVASGLDVVYPREHVDLWNRVAERGALMSEAPPGTQPEAYRFPLRNRILAAMSEVLVVVESRDRGGSLITANAARERGIAVLAVPGSLRNRAAEGTNALVRDGCPVVTDSSDVLLALGLDTSRTGAVAYDGRPRPSGFDREMLELCRDARTLDEIVSITGRTVVDCAMSLARLEASGWVQRVGGWFERVPAWVDLS